MTSDAVTAIDVISTTAVLTGPRLVAVRDLQVAMRVLAAARTRLQRVTPCTSRVYRMPKAEKEVESRPPSR